MEEIIAKLLTESGYVKRNPADPNFCDAYFNRELDDCVIVCEYSIESLAGFNESKKTKMVMQIFEEAKEQADIFKSTSLVMPLRLNDFSDYALIQNLVFSVEENPYAFRKYIALYTDEGVKNLEAKDGIKKRLEAILLDPGRFKSFEEERADDEFRTVTELFIKLPFMGIRGIPSVRLEEYESPLDLPVNTQLRDIYIETADIFRDSSELSFDEQIEALLENELVKEFVDQQGKET